MQASMDVITDKEVSTKVYMFLLSEAHPEGGTLMIKPYKPCCGYISRNTGESTKRAAKSMRKLEDLGVIWDIKDGLAIKDVFESKFTSLSKDAVRRMLREDLSRDEMSVLLYLSDKDRYSSKVGRMFMFSLGSICTEVLGRCDNSRNRGQVREILEHLTELGFIRTKRELCRDNCFRYKLLGIEL